MRSYIPTAAILACFSCIISFAGAETPYQQVERLYVNGTQLTAAEMAGWFTGRCFNKSQPDYPHPVLLIGEQRPIGPDGGPMFPAAEGLKLILSAPSQIPVYDSLENLSADDKGRIQT